MHPFVQSPGNWLNYNRYAYVMHNPLKFTDPSGYYPKELGNHPSPVTSDYNHDYTYGLGGGGFGQAEPNPFSFNNWWNAYIYASRKGFTGGLSNFQQQYFSPDAWSNGKLTLENHYWTQNSEIRNNEFYKVSTKHTSFVTISLNENPAGQGGEKSEPWLIVDFNKGILQIETNFIDKDWGAITPGPFIVYPKSGSKNKYYNSHEPGHVVQFLILGPVAYYGLVAIPSLITSTTPYHDDMPWEKSANQLWYWLTGENHPDNKLYFGPIKK